MMTTPVLYFQGWLPGLSICLVAQAPRALAVVILKFLMILFLNWCFVGKGQWDSRACIWTEEILVDLHILTALFACSIHGAPWAHNSAAPKRCRSFMRHKVSTSIISTTLKPCFCSNLNLLWTQKEGNSILRITNDQGSPSDSFVVTLLPGISTHFGWKLWHRRKKWGRSFASQSFLTHQ